MAEGVGLSSNTSAEKTKQNTCLTKDSNNKKLKQQAT
jgi:hypothetical protein